MKSKGIVILFAPLFLFALFLNSAIISSVFAQPMEVRINEIYPYPNSDSCTAEDWCQNEWIELYNPGDEEVDLSVYQLKDAAGHLFSDLAGQKIQPHGFLYVLDDDILNNTGDSVSLIKTGFADPIDNVEYGKATKSSSFSSFESGWRWVKIPTPGQKNILPASEDGTKAIENEPMAISQAKEKPASTQATVLGTITALPGTISSQYLYLQDESGGIQVYSYYKLFPIITMGDQVKVTGEISEYFGEKRLKISTASDIELISQNNVVTPTEKVQLADADAGTYITYQGTVDDPSGSQFEILSENSRIKVIIKNPELVKKPALRSGQIVQVSGICSSYKGELRILPFEEGSVKILSRGSIGNRLPEAGSALVNYLCAYLCIHTLWTISLIMKKRHLPSPRKLPKV